MRNCYVYRCNFKNKAKPSRAMFRVPKEPEKLELWKKALPMHRPFTGHDRVCELHFHPNDILRDWSHVIKGETTRVLRRKPNLRPDAIPSQFDFSQSELSSIALKRRHYNEALQEELEGSALPEATVPEEQPPKKCKPDEATERRAIFEDIYENVFEVELPSTLWGVHRDPDGQFIAFTRFDMNMVPSFGTSRMLLIESTLKCRGVISQHDSNSTFEEDLFPRMVPSANGSHQLSRFQVIANVIDSLAQTEIFEERDRQSD